MDICVAGVCVCVCVGGGGAGEVRLSATHSVYIRRPRDGRCNV